MKRWTPAQGVSRLVMALLDWPEGYRPTVRELSKVMGCSAARVQQLANLARDQKRVRWVEGKSRTMEVV